jgi:hypothetical protein
MPRIGRKSMSRHFKPKSSLCLRPLDVARRTEVLIWAKSNGESLKMRGGREVFTAIRRVQIPSAMPTESIILSPF